jgi:extracellular factor (EF) 3-hydroxypalmitic acid methyl ester biosynthesis protein
LTLPNTPAQIGDHSYTRTPDLALDEWYEAIRGGEVDDGMRGLASGLRNLRQSLAQSEWRTFVADFAEHPIAALVREDPFTWRAYTKPRGYPGDAELLDLLYDPAFLPPQASLTGRAIYRYAASSPACQAVRARRDVLAAAIDDIAATVEHPTIISIGCGHLREAQRARAVLDGRVKSLIACDMDSASLRVVDGEQRHLGVRTVAASVRDILAGRVELGQAHLVYAAGLYDYLPGREATLLTRRMFDMLHDGGRLLIANLTPELADIGYMEACMAWWLVYRGEAEMDRLLTPPIADQIQTATTFRDQTGGVVFLDARRA